MLQSHRFRRLVQATRGGRNSIPLWPGLSCASHNSLPRCSYIARKCASTRPRASVTRHGIQRRCQEGAPADQRRAWSYEVFRPSVPPVAAHAAKIVAEAVSGLAAPCAHCSVATTRPSLWGLHPTSTQAPHRRPHKVIVAGHAAPELRRAAAFVELHACEDGFTYGRKVSDHLSDRPCASTPDEGASG